MGEPRCKWVRDRLPLLAGDELFGTDRRRVERHLIGCAQCRAHRAALANALEVLHAASGESPSRPDAPTLWPALARQIQESRRHTPPPRWTQVVTWPRLALAAGLLGALGLTAEAHRQRAESRARIARAAQALPASPTLVTRVAPVPPRPALAPERIVRSDPDPESTTPRYDYVLDHGTPMGPDGADSKSTPSY